MPVDRAGPRAKGGPCRACENTRKAVGVPFRDAPCPASLRPTLTYVEGGHVGGGTVLLRGDTVELEDGAELVAVVRGLDHVQPGARVRKRVLAVAERGLERASQR